MNSLIKDISDEKYNKLKEKTLKFFKNHRKIKSPCFGEIKITPEGFNHIEWKNKNHKRSKKEAYVRYLCFLHIEFILSNSKLYQEFREFMQTFELKRKGKIFKENKMICLYGFVSIVNNNKNRVKIVIRNVDGWNNFEFVSVIPIWKKNGYSSDLYFDNEEDFLKSLIFEESKKLSLS